MNSSICRYSASLGSLSYLNWLRSCSSSSVGSRESRELGFRRLDVSGSVGWWLAVPDGFLRFLLPLAFDWGSPLWLSSSSSSSSSSPSLRLGWLGEAAEAKFRLSVLATCAASAWLGVVWLRTVAERSSSAASDSAASSDSLSPVPPEVEHRSCVQYGMNSVVPSLAVQTPVLATCLHPVFSFSFFMFRLYNHVQYKQWYHDGKEDHKRPQSLYGMVLLFLVQIENIS